MPYLTLESVFKRNGDALIGLVDDVINNAPEIRYLPAMVKPEISYTVSRVIQYPQVQFADVNQGVPASASVFDSVQGQMKYVNAQLQVRQSVIDSDPGKKLEDLLTGEAKRVLAQVFIALGQTIYYGTTVDPKGFQGFQQLISGVSGFEIDAVAYTNTKNSTSYSANSSGSNCSAYLVRCEEDAVSMAVGNNGQIKLTPWQYQQVAITNPDGTTGFEMAWVSSLQGYFGLTLASNYSVWRIKNLSSKQAFGSGGHAFPLTDDLADSVIANIPAQFRSGNLKWFIPRDAEFALKSSRTAVNAQIVTAEGGYAISPIPTRLSNYDVVLTESLKNPFAGSGGE